MSNYLRSLSLTLYAVSSILASSLAIHYHITRYIRRKKYHDSNFYEDFPDVQTKRNGPIQHVSAEQWLEDYSQAEANRASGHRRHPQ